jgi:hypothetical protein
MSLSILASFAKFLQANQYSTSMWERGYDSAEVNEVCDRLTQWAKGELELQGEFLILWSALDGTQFSGDNELIYLQNGKAYLIPNPFIEGESEEFIAALQRILHGRFGELFEVPIQRRILYNAV